MPLNVGAKFRRLLALDTLLLKAAKATPELVSLQVEARLYNAVALVYARRARAAVLGAAAAWLKGPGVEGVVKAASAAFEGFAEEVAPLVRAATEAAYITGKSMAREQVQTRAKVKAVEKASGTPPPGGKKGKGGVPKGAKAHEIKPNFTLEDKAAIDALAVHQVYWIGKFHDSLMSEAIAEDARKTLLESGLDSREGAKALVNRLTTAFGYDPKAPKGPKGSVFIPSSWKGEPDAYFRGLAANVATTARTTGSVNEYTALGVSHYVIANPKDERTCVRCNGMTGRDFEVKAAKALSQQIISSKVPDDVRKLQPWLTQAEFLRESHSTANLQRLGYMMPPFHYRCRCRTDISDKATLDFSDLPEDEGSNPTWTTPPKDETELTARLKVLAKWQFGAELTSYDGVTEDSPDVGSGAIAHRSWGGYIHLARGEPSRRHRKLLAAGAKGLELDLDSTEALSTLVHEHLHGLGEHKKPKPASFVGLTDYQRAYIVEYGRVIEEGAVEHSAVRLYKDWARRMGYKVSTDENKWASRRVRRNVGTSSEFLDAHHAYTREVSIVEALAQAAGGEAKLIEGAALSNSSINAMNGMLHEWDPMKRVERISEAIAKAHPGNGKETMVTLRAFYVQQLLTRGTTKSKPLSANAFRTLLEVVLKPNNSSDLDYDWATLVEPNL